MLKLLIESDQTFQPSRFGMPNTALPLNLTVDQKAVGASVRLRSSLPPEVFSTHIVKSPGLRS